MSKLVKALGWFAFFVVVWAVLLILAIGPVRSAQTHLYSTAPDPGSQPLPFTGPHAVIIPSLLLNQERDAPAATSADVFVGWLEFTEHIDLLMQNGEVYHYDKPRIKRLREEMDSAIRSYRARKCVCTGQKESK